ncbi:hypothetical protein O181_114356 [Austropuccinia psidii MF-1]|uniref:Uncharacterized protein n=1 Tax=Austropuccinia psidii MF-1 TaxID=1389203 RepID=A0A9Q3PV92_9BASI|nr:hypothetical protein [Austropuccinia psidii MF-1]
MKDLRIVTGPLSKMMTSNHSSNYSSSFHRGRKPTTCLEYWKEYCSQDKSCSSDRSQYSSRNQEITQCRKCSKSSTELEADHMENTGSEVCSGNTTVKLSLDSDLSPASKPNTLEEYCKGTNANTIEKGSNPSFNLLDTNSKKIFNKEEHNLKPTTIHNSSNINKRLSETMDSTFTKINYDIISKDFSNRSPYPLTAMRKTKYINPTNNTKTKISNLNTNCTSSNKNKLELKTIDAAVTENKEETILSKVVN